MSTKQTASKTAVAKLYNYLAVAALQGNKIEPGSFAVKVDIDDDTEIRGKVCLCGSVLVATGVDIDTISDLSGEGIIRAVAKKLGITLKQAASLNNGFEAIEVNDSTAGAYFEYGKDPLEKGVDKQWFKIGTQLRSIYNGAQ